MPKTTEELYRELLAKGDAAQQQANDLLTEYDNRAAFAYDPNADGSFQALKNQYVHQGRRAMEDTMGQAAGLTGGYGSSYSQAVGNQAYNEYLTQLNAQIPALAQQARAAYDAEGQRMLDRYNLALNAANTAYNQGRDALGDLRYEEELAYNRGQADQERAYNMVMTMLSTGQTPSADLLAAAGVGADYASKLAKYYAGQLAGSGSGGGVRYVYRDKGNTEDGDTTNSIDGNVIKPAEREKLLQYALSHSKDDFDAYFSKNYGKRENYKYVYNWIRQQILKAAKESAYNNAGGSGGGGGKPNLDVRV